VWEVLLAYFDERVPEDLCRYVCMHVCVVRFCSFFIACTPTHAHTRAHTQNHIHIRLSDSVFFS
jgi:hypothetical protein